MVIPQGCSCTWSNWLPENPADTQLRRVKAAIECAIHHTRA